MPQPTPDSENNNDGDPLNMPDPKSGDNPENMSWLRGCWNSSTGFTSKRTGEDMEYYYCFDEKGNANVYANVKDQNGQIIDTCRGGAKAQLKDGAMVVESQTAAVCKDGMRNFVPSKVTCKPGEKEAECSLGQSGVDRDFSTRFTKRE
jgi:hypothetical protein